MTTRVWHLRQWWVWLCLELPVDRLYSLVTLCFSLWYHTTWRITPKIKSVLFGKFALSFYTAFNDIEKGRISFQYCFYCLWYLIQCNCTSYRKSCITDIWLFLGVIFQLHTKCQRCLSSSKRLIWISHLS